MAAKIPHEITHAQIQERIQARERMDAKHWQSNPPLSKLYWRVKNHKFDGNGTWYGYLEKEHGISVLDAETGSYPQKDILKLVEIIKSGQKIDLTDWERKPELISLYHRLKRRCRSGVLFDGCGNFAKFAASNLEIRVAMSKRIRNAIKSIATVQKDAFVELKQLAKKAGISTETIVSFVRSAPGTAIILRNLGNRYSCIFDPLDRAQAIAAVYNEMEKGRMSLNPRVSNTKISRLNVVLERLYRSGNLGVLECGG